ncbi:hypothetical protein RRG08_048597 [Elysia crispata]|uniref:Uncharacterized protein n=1 Tax=Elysia crispata TaxID=231223 RepID=A0AAE1DWC1_9GAST|nr:hypothetical protein RRG08_048597 [Elysia crispata]
MGRRGYIAKHGLRLCGVACSLLQHPHTGHKTVQDLPDPKALGPCFIIGTAQYRPNIAQQNASLDRSMLGSDSSISDRNFGPKDIIGGAFLDRSATSRNDLRNTIKRPRNPSQALTHPEVSSSSHTHVHR